MTLNQWFVLIDKNDIHLFIIYEIISSSFLDNASADDTVGDLKLLIAAQTGTRPEKIILKKW